MKTDMIRFPARVLTTLAVVALGSGCAMKGDIRLLQDELRAVSARQDSLMTEIRMQTAQTQDTLRTQGDAMFDLRGDINRQLQQIGQALLRLEAIAGENQRGLSSIRDQLANMRRSTGGGTVATPPDDSAGGSGGGSESLVGGSTDLWEAARTQAQRGSLNSAARAFEDFMRQYPDDPRVPDAHFQLADILEQQDRPQDALEAFQEIPSLFPTHESVPNALIRIASLQLDMDDEAGAKATLERIVNTYPGTMMGMLARDMLAEIG